jgi:hypothetical protein
MIKQMEYPQLLVFSQFPWDHLPQRSRDLLLRESSNRKIYLVEEPLFSQTELPFLQLNEIDQNILIVTPHLPKVIHPENVHGFMRDLIDNLIFEEEIINFGLWYFDAMAVNFTDHLEPVSMQFVSLDDSPKKKTPHFTSLDLSMSSII